MVYTTKFHKIGMFKRFSLGGTVYLRVGRDIYQNVTTGTESRIASLGTEVIQVNDDYYWSAT